MPLFVKKTNYLKNSIIIKYNKIDYFNCERLDHYISSSFSENYHNKVKAISEFICNTDIHSIFPYQVSQNIESSYMYESVFTRIINIIDEVHYDLSSNIELLKASIIMPDENSYFHLLNPIKNQKNTYSTLLSSKSLTDCEEDLVYESIYRQTLEDMYPEIIKILEKEFLSYDMEIYNYIYDFRESATDPILYGIPKELFNKEFFETITELFNEIKPPNSVYFLLYYSFVQAITLLRVYQQVYTYLLSHCDSFLVTHGIIYYLQNIL